MPNVRIAGKVAGETDPNRESRARLLYSLFSNGWNILNSNGDELISLSNIERKIVEADAFVFTPGPTLEDRFKAISIFVGYQTLDGNLEGKPTVILNPDGSWDALYQLLDHLREMGTIREVARDYLIEATDAKDVLKLLREVRKSGIPDVEREPTGTIPPESYETELPADHKGNVCVFCSASMKDEDYLRDGYELGKALAGKNLGCVSGAGNSGIMGEVVRGAVDAGGWTAGSNVPHIIELEGLPEGLSSFWLKPDIYTRMQVMIERSDAFVIFPGGAGTVQEMLALLILKQQGDKEMGRKPIVIFDRKDASGKRFWTPLIALLEGISEEGDFVVVEDFEKLVPTIEDLLEKADSVSSNSSKLVSDPVSTQFSVS